MPLPLPTDRFTRRVLAATGLFLLAWLLFAELAAPALIRWLYTSDAAGSIELVAEERAEKPLSYFLDRWHMGSRWAVAAVAGILLVHLAVGSEAYRRRHVGEATPGALGAIRALVAGILLVNVLWEDLASSALLPRAMADPSGALDLLAPLPGWEAFAASPLALGLFHAVTGLLLLAVLAGWRTRWTVPLAAVAYLVFGGLLRQYTHAFHTGLVTWYALVVLCFTRCGDGWSVDRLLRVRRGEPVPAADRPARVYGWGRYAVWLTIAISYVEAGLSKLRRSGWEWLEPESFQAIVLTDTLNPMHFDWGLSFALLELPPAVSAALAATALFGEVLFGLVLVSRLARKVLPALMVGMHLGILLFQNVLFFDLILVQAVFYDWRPVADRLAGVARPLPDRLRVALTGGRVAREPAAPPVERSAADRRWRRRAVTIAAVLLVVWATRIEAYPLTGMQMYARADTDGTVEYLRVLAVAPDGDTFRAPIEQAVGAMVDTRYRWLMEGSFESAEDRRVAEELLRTVALRHNRSAPPGRRIAGYRVELRRWDFVERPEDPDRGETVAGWRIDLRRTEGEPPELRRSAASATAP